MTDPTHQDPKAIKRIVEESREHVLDRGLVIAVRDRFLDVQLDGSKKLVRNVIVPQHIDEIEVGWWVALVKLPRSINWIALAALEDLGGGSRPTVANLPQPADVTATANPYYIELSWSGSFRLEATYEIQHNSSAVEAGATLIKWEGSNFFYWCAAGTQRYFRVRAVDENFERSSWSDWVNATATTGVEDMFLALDAALAPEWVAFVWNDVAAVAGANMVHTHASAAQGGTHWGGITQTFGGGAGANIVTIPDAINPAITLVDDGGVPVEFLRIDTLNNEIVFNHLELDVDVRFAALAMTNAFFLRGLDGHIAWGGPSLVVSANWEFQLSDNVACAMRFIDVGDANDYLTFVTTNLSREVVINADEYEHIDFRVAASGETNALVVRGSDGRTGAGNTPVTNARFRAYESSTLAAGSAYGIYTDCFATPAGASTASFYGVRSTVAQASGQALTSVQALRGYFGGVALSGTGLVTGAMSITGQLAASVAGAQATTVKNILSRAYCAPAPAAGTVGTLSMFYAENPIVGAGGVWTITTLHGLYIENMTRGATNYAIYSAGGRSYHVGTLAVGGTNSVAAQLYVDQSAAGGAIPGIYIDQGDVSEQHIVCSMNGADVDFPAIIELAVTGTPALWWDESADAFAFTNGLEVGDVGGGNYTHIEADGSLEFNGTATVFNDLYFPMTTGKIGGANQPTWAAFQGNTFEYTFAINDYIHLPSQEITHSYKEGSDITLHVHIVLDGSDVGDTDVNYEIEYTIGDMNEAMSAAALATSGDYTITGGTADRTHLYIAIGTIAGATYLIGAALKIRFRRIALTGGGNAPSNDPFVLMAGAHIEEDTVGSRTELAK